MDRKIIILAALAVVIVAVVVYSAVIILPSAQVVKAGDSIQVYYTGEFTNGTVFNSNVGQQPFNFTVGANEVIPGFDNAVLGMKAGQTKNVTIPASDAYGEVNRSLIATFPISEFGNQSVEVGMIFTKTGPDGQQVEGTVTAVNSTNATLNFNPPLAGQTLLFIIKVVSISK
ncbi:MAG: FKBP-type peptidyl-prolyl cis-trans isomerase [Candidatus Micrarchaeaceae archaeon]